MDIIPICFDSFSVRSMCTFVKTKKLNILIDPGVALGPRRYGLKPSEYELRSKQLYRDIICSVAKLTDIILITHYHYDHIPFPKDLEMHEKVFKNKIVIVKHPKKSINKSQKKRAAKFLKIIENLASEIHYADNQSFNFGNITIDCSPPVYHGKEGTKLGWVTMYAIKDKSKTFIHGGDAQGIEDNNSAQWIIDEDPDILFIDGFPTYFIGFRYSKKDFEKSKENIIKVMENTNVKQMIIDHHIARDKDFKSKLSDVFNCAKDNKVEILTAAEYLGVNNLFLEAYRKELYNNLYGINFNSFLEEYINKIFNLLEIDLSNYLKQF